MTRTSRPAADIAGKDSDAAKPLFSGSLNLEPMHQSPSNDIRPARCGPRTAFDTRRADHQTRRPEEISMTVDLTRRALLSGATALAGGGWAAIAAGQPTAPDTVTPAAVASGSPPGSTGALEYLSAGQLTEGLRRKRFSSLELTNHLMASRIPITGTPRPEASNGATCRTASVSVTSKISPRPQSRRCGAEVRRR